MLFCFFIFIYLAHILFDIILVKPIKYYTHFLKVYSPGNIMFVISRISKAMEFPSSPLPSAWQWPGIPWTLQLARVFITPSFLSLYGVCGHCLTNLLITFSWLFYFSLFCSPFSANQPPPLNPASPFLINGKLEPDNGPNVKPNAEGQLNLNGHVRIKADVEHLSIQRVIIEHLFCARPYSRFWILQNM